MLFTKTFLRFFSSPFFEHFVKNAFSVILVTLQYCFPLYAETVNKAEEGYTHVLLPM